MISIECLRVSVSLYIMYIFARAPSARREADGSRLEATAPMPTSRGLLLHWPAKFRRSTFESRTSRVVITTKEVSPNIEATVAWSDAMSNHSQHDLVVWNFLDVLKAKDARNPPTGGGGGGFGAEANSFVIGCCSALTANGLPLLQQGTVPGFWSPASWYPIKQ